MINGADSTDREIHNALRRHLRAERASALRHIELKAARLRGATGPPPPESTRQERRRLHRLTGVTFLLATAALCLSASLIMKPWWTSTAVHPYSRTAKPVE